VSRVAVVSCAWTAAELESRVAVMACAWTAAGADARSPVASMASRPIVLDVGRREDCFIRLLGQHWSGRREG
jgi:hypothetical protein